MQPWTNTCSTQLLSDCKRGKCGVSFRCRHRPLIEPFQVLIDQIAGENANKSGFKGWTLVSQNHIVLATQLSPLSWCLIQLIMICNPTGPNKQTINIEEIQLKGGIRIRRGVPLSARSVFLRIWFPSFCKPAHKKRKQVVRLRFRPNPLSPSPPEFNLSPSTPHLRFS